MQLQNNKEIKAQNTNSNSDSCIHQKIEALQFFHFLVPDEIQNHLDFFSNKVFVDSCSINFSDSIRIQCPASIRMFYLLASICAEMCIKAVTATPLQNTYMCKICVCKIHKCKIHMCKIHM